MKNIVDSFGGADSECVRFALKITKLTAKQFSFAVLYNPIEICPISFLWKCRERERPP